jgi:hypothetical protein
MVDYKDTKIYYIQVGNERYYGHTAQKYLCQREGHHRYKLRKGNTEKLYQQMRSVGMTANDIKCVFVEHYPCKSIEEAKQREQEWIRKDGALNTYIPNRTWEEYKAENKDKIRERDRTHYNENKDKINEKRREQWATMEKITCPICAEDIHQTSLKLHMQRAHPEDESKVQCPHCKKSKSKDVFKRHISKKHPEEYLKEQEEKNQQKEVIKQHKYESRNNKVQCQHCDIQIHKRGMKRHIERMHNNATP